LITAEHPNNFLTQAIASLYGEITSLFYCQFLRSSRSAEELPEFVGATLLKSQTLLLYKTDFIRV
jgi:hypothetical protein